MADLRRTTSIRYLQDVRPPRSPVMAEMEQFAEREARADRALGDRPLPRDARARDSTRRWCSRSGPRSATRRCTWRRRSATARSSRSSATPIACGRRPSTSRAPASRTASRSWRATRWRRSTASTARSTSSSWTATKTEYPRYLELAEPKAAERAVLVVDNMLMSGRRRARGRLRGVLVARRTSRARGVQRAELVRSERWLGAVLPIGDGVVFAARR